jgi:PAS domain S-box-containing protein
MTASMPSHGAESGDASKPATELFYKRNTVTGEFYHLTPSAGPTIGTSFEVLVRESLEEAKGRIHRDDQELNDAKLRELTERGSGTMTCELRIKRDDGSYMWVRHIAEVLRDENGVPCILMGVVKDISQSKAVQAHMEELQLRYENLWRKANVAVCETRMDGTAILSCNERWARLMGYSSAEECVKLTVPTKDYVDPELRKNVIAQLSAGSPAVETEARMSRRDGRELWLHLSFLMHADGEAIDVVGVDVTIRKLLSPREREVLRHLMAGLNNKEIALKLSRSLRTIENHRAAIMLKLGVKSSFELAKRVADCDLG